MTPSQKTAYIQGIVSGKFNGIKQQIYNLLKEKDLTLEQLCKHFDKTPNEISGRISELLDLGLIKVKQSGRYSLLTICSEQEIENQRRKRHLEEIEKWYKKGKELGIKFVTETPKLF
jgi:DNA-binding transcriptional ArsR family regulator